MSRLKPSPIGYWNEERCRDAAKKCKSIEEFRTIYESRPYTNCRKRGQVNTLIRDMCDNGFWSLPEKMPCGYWTLEKCKEVCKKYDCQADLIREHPKVYAAVKDHGWQQECFAPMRGKKAPNNFWTLEKCKQEASKYDSPANMKRGNSKAYSAMKNNGWYDECCAEMMNRRVPNNFWTEERIVDVMLTTSSRTEFQENYPGAYGAANELGIYERLTKMMVEQEL